MAKSTGNNILPREILTGENSILSKAFPASVARFFMLQAHYRSILDFSDDAVAAEKGYKRLMEAVATLKQLNANTDSTIDIATWKQSCYDAMNDDFNSPILIAQLFEVRFINLLHDGKETLNAVDLDIFSNALWYWD
jgi:cysteinyl-tRNA synthetase